MTDITLNASEVKPNLRVVKEERLLDDLRILDWEDIKKINTLGAKKKFNRVFDLRKFKSYLSTALKERGYDLSITKFPARPIMLHEHRAGQKCEPHMRVSIRFSDLPCDTFYIDCDLKLWESFPVYKMNKKIEIMRDPDV
jgi:hypothetical protein